MKNGIDILLILVLLITIAFLLYFGLGSGRAADVPLPLTTSTTTKVVPITDTSIPKLEQTATLIPASVTIPTKTKTATPRATETVTRTATATLTLTPSNTTPISPLTQEVNSGIERANRIIQAIEEYYAAKGVYPSTLNDLSPTYLPDIPLTPTGQAYFYRLFDGSSPLASDVYWVSFRAINQDHVTCTYFRRLDYWDCDYASP